MSSRGEEAHIVAEEDNGPHGDPSMPPSERNAYGNLILRCGADHRLIGKDNGIHFSVAQLQRIKTVHETLAQRRRIGLRDAEHYEGDVLTRAAIALTMTVRNA